MSVAIKCELKVEYFYSERKGGRYTPHDLEILKDSHGNYVLETHSKSSKKSYKLSNNISQVYRQFTSQGKASIQLTLPSVLLLIQKAVPQDLVKFVQVLQKIQTDPDFDIEGGGKTNGNDVGVESEDGDMGAQDE